MRLSVMPRHPMSAPDLSAPIPPNPGELRKATDDVSFDGDFAYLVARFAGKSGGNLSPELSADLAFQVVLNEIAEQACLATGATGAAIVLQREGAMICRARSGVTAPELGTRFDGASGLSGECVKTGQTQCCDDVLADSRADTEASHWLGVRSVMVMPLLRKGALVGLFELFSSQPRAFGERDERTLEALASRILSTQERAAQWNEQSAEQNEISPPAAPEPHGEILLNTLPTNPAGSPSNNPSNSPTGSPTGSPPNSPENSSRRRFDYFTWILGAVVVACAILLAVQVSRHLGSRTAKVHRHPTVTSSREGSASNVVEPDAAPNKEEPDNASRQQSPPKPGVKPSVPSGGLLVFENGKEVFRLPPAQAPGQEQAAALSTGQESGMQQGSSVGPESRVELSPAAAQSILLRRVEPVYPEEARQQKVQGPVVLEVHIGADGAVQNVEVVRGPPELARASIDAVKQWRFKPRTEKGRPAEMQSRVTLNFKLQD